MIPPFEPVIVQLGPFAIHWYGVLIVTGIMLGAVVATYLAREAGENPDYIWDGLVVAVILAVIGARLYHVFSQPAGGLIGWDYYRQNPVEIFYVWKGGLGIFGAIIGGAVGVILYAIWRRLRPLQWLDFGAPGLALGQAIGRWGNYMNRELYGPPTTLPWGLRIPAMYRIPPYTDLVKYPPDTRFHPTFLYESLGALIVFLVLFGLAVRYRDRLKEGDLLVGYLMGYSIVRFGVEFFRPDAWKIGAIATAQLFSLGFIVLGVIFLVVRHWPARRSDPAA
jgi:phosphatidylglycerol:prolipoprotein diacylglycerol transferase